MINSIRHALIFARLRWRFKHWSEAQIQRHQQRRLKKLLKFLSQNSIYYGDQQEDTSPIRFSRLQPLNKTRLMDQFNQINTAGLDLDALIQFKVDQEQNGLAELFEGKHSIGLSSGTSGTSGNQGLTVLSARERQDYGPLIMARTHLPKIGEQYRVLFALRVNNPAFMEIMNKKLYLTYVNYTHNPEHLVRVINEKRLNVLAGPPSLLRILADYVKQLDRPTKAIISYAEVLTPQTKKFLEETYSSPVLQIYQGAEGFLAGTCSVGNLHLNEDTTLVELFDVAEPDSNIKRVVITDLYRTTLPFIRYELNDLIEIDPDACSCGSKFRRIKQIHGRADDLFELQGFSGEVKFLFPDYIRRSIIQASPDIREYQAIQKNSSDIEIRLVFKPGAPEKEIKARVILNLERWIDRVGAEMPGIHFSKTASFTYPQSIMTPHNPDYYEQYFHENKFMVSSRSLSLIVRKEKLHLPALLLPWIKIRHFDPEKLKTEIETFHQLQVAVFNDREGYVPRTLDQDEVMIRALLPLFDPELVVIADNHKGKAVGMLIALPDHYQQEKPPTRARILSIGILPGYQAKGVGTMLVRNLAQTLVKKGYQSAEVSWVLKNNKPPQILSQLFGAETGREFCLYGKQL